MSYSRLTILVWLSAWMLSVPLVHVHPEVDHRHGQTSHVHGGTTHTVFSSDLPCEYQADSLGDALSVASQSTHALDHPEIGFSLLASSPERGSGKPVLGDAVFEGTLRLLPHLSWKFISAVQMESAVSIVLPTYLSTRAPPASAR
jgi:hypothetical protein